jgi:minor histocompatibility antigen H13
MVTPPVQINPPSRVINPTPTVAFSTSFTNVHIGAFVVAVAITAAHVYTSAWPLSNLFALGFSFNAIALLRLDSFTTGAFLLGGLFVYDVWWVFGTEVMVSVAKVTSPLFRQFTNQFP